MLPWDSHKEGGQCQRSARPSPSSFPFWVQLVGGDSPGFGTAASSHLG